MNGFVEESERRAAHEKGNMNDNRKSNGSKEEEIRFADKQAFSADF